MSAPAPSIANGFPATRWTLIDEVRSGSDADVQAALNCLCRAYWQPLYSVARFNHLSVHDAQDAVQGFFETLVRHALFSKADAAKGKLRHLLLRAFSNYCGQQWIRGQRKKRGGGAVHEALTGAFSMAKAEKRYLKSHFKDLSMESLFNRQWAETVLERSLVALKVDYARRGWNKRFQLLVGPLLQDGGDTSLVELAAGTDTTVGALRVNLHRMRAHFRDKIERELAATLNTEDVRIIREEMAELRRAFS